MVQVRRNHNRACTIQYLECEAYDLLLVVWTIIHPAVLFPSPWFPPSKHYVRAVWDWFTKYNPWCDLPITYKSKKSHEEWLVSDKVVKQRTRDWHCVQDEH